MSLASFPPASLAVSRPMVPTTRLPRIAVARPMRAAVLALLAIGHLPVPVVHSHGAAGDLCGSIQLGRHLALFHNGCSESDGRRLHVHVVPPMFFAQGSADDATGEDAPEPGADDALVPTVVPAGHAPLAVAVIGADAFAAGPSVSPIGRAPTHFLETFSSAADLSGLLGVCRC